VKQFAIFFYLELLLLWRHFQDWLFPACFFAIVLCLFPVIFSEQTAFLKEYAPACIWQAMLFMTLFSVQTIFLSDMEDLNIEQIFLSDTPLSLYIVAKLAAHWLVMQASLATISILAAYVFQLSIDTLLILLTTLLIASPILLLIGSLAVALSFGLRSQGVLLGILFLPLVIPIVILAMTAIHVSLAHLDTNAPLAFLTGIAILSISLLPFAISYALRLSLD